ncbi:MAG TPA: hypothetical protein VEO01_12475 [Pseudonocardiaceae bacterium]|nr:hypothetical protein [Pseudonocardiaceae bacterium]
MTANSRPASRTGGAYTRRRASVIAAVAALVTATVLTIGTPAHAAAAPLVADPASLVNTLVATTGGGNVFPRLDAPFGMIQSLSYG